ncbi:MAG: DUF2726 domain-containing protein [Anaerolineales bacterium]|nr:DUF2726 domain-containing protein [Anaerolineales bacterium]
MNSEIVSWAFFLGPLVLAVLVVMFLGRLRSRKENRVDLSKYALKESVMSLAEVRFYKVLSEVVGTKYEIMVKPRLVDMFAVTSGNGFQAAWNRISQKHADFLLCDPITFEPLLSIELDDRSHQSKNRAARDEFVDSLYANSGLKVMHVPAARAYRAEDLRDEIIAAFRENGGK